MSVRNMNFAPSGNNDNSEGMPDVTEKPEVNVNRQGYIDWRKEKSESEKAQALEAQRLAREKYYKEQHDLREEQYNHEADTSKDAERNENDRKIELRHQFDQVKLEADTFLKMQANLAEREFLSKAFSAEDKKNTNEALDAATEKFNKLDEEAIKLTRELKAGGRKLTFEDYQKIDAAWGASAAAEAKMNEIKNADKKEIAFDFAQNQYKKIQKSEQMSGVEGSFLSKFNVLTGEDTIEKFEPTVKDKMGGVAAGMTSLEGENGPKQTVEFPPAIVPGEGVKKGNQLVNPGTGENNPKDDPKNPEDGSKDSKEKKGFVASVVEKIKKHGDGIRKFLLAGAIAVTAGILAYGGYKLATNQNTAVEQGMDKDNNGNTDGNVEEALEKHDANGETNVDDSEKLNETVSYNVMVDGVEKTVELSDEVDTSAPDFTNPNRHLNDFGYMDMSKLKEMKEQGASEEAMGFEAMNMLNEALRNPHILANTGANLGVFGDIDSYEDVNEITNMIQNGDDESRAAIRHEVNEALAEFWSGATPKIGILKAGTPYESCFATQVGGDGNFQINIARDMNGVVHDHDVFYLYGEKDGQDIFNKNELGGIKEKMMKKLGVIKATDNADVRMAKMESGHCIVLEECSGQDGYVLDVKDVPVLHFNQEKTHVDVTPTNTPENTETNNDKPAPKNETSAPKPKNETPPAPTPNENPKTPETNVNDGKTNTASANEDDIKLGEVVKEAGFTNREGTNDLNVQTNLPGSEVTDKAQFDAMVKESIEQNSNPNTTWTFQDNSQGIVHQEGVATEKQADAENRSVLSPETRPEQSTPEGSVSAGDKTSTAEDKDGLMSAAKSDNTTTHESGQTRTVETSVSE